MTDNSMKSIYQKRTRIGDNILKVLIYLAAGVAIALLVGIMGYVFATCRRFPGSFCPRCRAPSRAPLVF